MTVTHDRSHEMQHHCIKLDYLFLDARDRDEHVKFADFPDDTTLAGEPEYELRFYHVYIASKEFTKYQEHKNYVPCALWPTIKEKWDAYRSANP